MMRVPDSIKEFEHMLNAEGWSRSGQRKQGTRMKHERSADFLEQYRQRVSTRLAVLKARVESMGQMGVELPPHLRLQKKLLEAEIVKRSHQLAVSAGD